MEAIPLPRMDFSCKLCGSSQQDVKILGEMSTYNDVMLHRNCLVMSLGKVVRNGADYFSFLTFLEKELMIQVDRFNLITCVYCQRPGANLSCCQQNCERSFHTKCGVDNFALLEYGGRFNVFCDMHVPEPPARPEPDDVCVLCLYPVVNEGGIFNGAVAFKAPCCRSGWLHRACAQELSVLSEYNVKCPLCRNEDRYGDVALHGISVPKWRFTLPTSDGFMVLREARPRIIYSAPVPHRGRVSRRRPSGALPPPVALPPSAMLPPSVMLRRSVATGPNVADRTRSKTRRNN